MSARCDWENTPMCSVAAGEKIVGNTDGVRPCQTGHEMDRALSTSSHQRFCAEVLPSQKASCLGKSVSEFVSASDAWVTCGKWNNCLKRVDSGRVELKHTQSHFVENFLVKRFASSRGIFRKTPELHIAFCPIFVHTLFPTFKNGLFLSVVAFVSVTLIVSPFT